MTGNYNIHRPFIRSGIIAMFIFLGMSTVLSDKELPDGTAPRGIYNNPYFYNNRIVYDGDVEKIDRILNRFIERWDIAAASLAVARDGKIIYTRAFGFANREDTVSAEPYHLFRIASISKLITATAVMKLVEEGRLSLNDYVFGERGILNDSIYVHAKDRRAYDIKIIHLLEHSAGWLNRYGDQMFMPVYIAQQMKSGYPPDIQTIIRFALSKKLHFTPGAYRSYSNLGYSILSEVVARVTGMPYEKYVKENIMAPIGVIQCHIGNNTEEGRLKDEVSYYEPQGSDSILSCNGSGKWVLRSNGGNDIRTLAGAGGWVFSSVDLLKFVLAIDGDSIPPEILEKESVTQMMGNMHNDSLLGWRNADNHGNIWRTGFFAGSTGLVMKQNDGFTWVMLLNSSAWKGSEFSVEMLRTMRQVFTQVNRWPEKDLLYHMEARPIDPKHNVMLH